jgi:hypothetical protein
MSFLDSVLTEDQQDALELALLSSGLTQTEFVHAALRYAVMDTARGGNIVRATHALRGTEWPQDASGVLFANQLTGAKR